MSRLFMFEKPLGMRDTLPLLYEAKQQVCSRLEKEIKSWGYQFIGTPTLEYGETVGAASAILDQQLFKLLDRDGHTLVLRPDMTAPIARVAASKLLNEELPVRLAYSANVFRAQQREGGRPAEFEQVGVECIGDGTVSADAEMMMLAVSSLKAAGLEGFQLSVGHSAFVMELYRQILGTEERAAELVKFLYEKNYVGYQEHVKSLPLSSIDSQRLLAFLDLKGGPEVFEKAMSLTESENGKRAISDLERLWRITEEYGGNSHIQFDLTLVSHMSYYTGILFEIYAGKIGFPLGNGGRYDGLLQKFGKTTGATGFAIRLDRLLEALGNIEQSLSLTCILFSGERRKEAFDLAKELRASGGRVVLQDIGGVKNIDAYSSRFEEMILLVGNTGKEQGNG